MIIGITGGTGCGKTTLLTLLKDQGGLILDCDAIYHQLLKSSTKMLLEIENRFPGVVENGELNRKKLGNIVFADAKALEDLNQITHKEVKKVVLTALQSQPRLAAIDAIGLFEGGLAELCDTTVAVLAPREARIRRLMARDGISESYASSRIDAQPSDDWFREKCDHTLENDGTEEQFREKCLAFFIPLGIMNA